MAPELFVACPIAAAGGWAMASSTAKIAEPFSIMATMYHTKLLWPCGCGDTRRKNGNPWKGIGPAYVWDELVDLVGIEPTTSSMP